LFYAGFFTTHTGAKFKSTNRINRLWVAGLYSPMAQQVLNSDFAVAINLPMVIVVKDELGAINQALLSIEAAKKHWKTAD
jgi:hypothetical protein